MSSAKSDTRSPDAIASQKRLALRRAARSPASVFFNFVVFPAFILVTLWSYLQYDFKCLLIRDCTTVESRAIRILRENPLIGNNCSRGFSCLCR